MVEFVGLCEKRGNIMCVKIPTGVDGPLSALLSKSGGYLCLRLKKPGRPRTTGERSQCNHVNGHVRQLVVETGNDFETVKLAAKIRAMDMGYPGEDFRGLHIPLSEAQATTEQAAILIEALHLIAAEMGIVLEEE
jgi:hypothetical protein